MWGIELKFLEFSISITENLPMFQHFSSLCKPYTCRCMIHNSSNLKTSNFQMRHPEGTEPADIHLMQAPHSPGSDDSSIPEGAFSCVDARRLTY